MRTCSALMVFFCWLLHISLASELRDHTYMTSAKYLDFLTSWSKFANELHNEIHATFPTSSDFWGPSSRRTSYKHVPWAGGWTRCSTPGPARGRRSTRGCWGTAPSPSEDNGRRVQGEPSPLGQTSRRSMWFQTMAISCITFRKKELSYWNLFEDRNGYFTQSGLKF